MSRIVEFFIAPDDEAARRVADLVGGPSGEFDTLDKYGNFDPEEAMRGWDVAFADLDFPYVPTERGRRYLGDPAVSTVIAASDFMVTSMAKASQKSLGKAAKRWAKQYARDEGVELGDFADTLLSDVATLARRAAAQGQHLYCWTV
jgi:hypothetical protein